VIATDVAEEGIDVAACNLVVAFDPSPSLKSFIQRRGRARAVDSRFAVMLPVEGAEGSKLVSFEKLEEDLNRAYQDDVARLEAQRAREDVYEVNEDVIHVASTGWVCCAVLWFVWCSDVNLLTV